MVVGKASVYYENDGVYLANFKVFEKYRGRGYADAMMQLCIDLFHIDTLIVSQSNKAAITLYKKHGFKIIDSYYTNDLGEDVYYMKCLKGGCLL